MFNVCSISDEIQYRIDRFRERVGFFAEKKIVIYGTGVNAKRILTQIPELNVIGLMDNQHTGEYIFGKRVLSEREVLLLNIDAIILATEPHSTKIVYSRISDFCTQNNIMVFDMHGRDETKLRKNILEQEIYYPNFSEENLKHAISDKNVIVIEAEGILFSALEISQKELLTKVEEIAKKENIETKNFKCDRLRAEERVTSKNVNLKDVYTILSSFSNISKTDLTRLREIEESVRVENLFPRHSMLAIMQYMIREGKKVYVRFEMTGGEAVLEVFLKKYGVENVQFLPVGNRSLDVTTCINILSLGRMCGFDKILYIGCNHNDSLIIPQLYDVNIVLIQETRKLFLANSRLNLEKNEIENCFTEKIWNIIFFMYDLPYIEDARIEECDAKVSKEIGWRDGNGEISLELLPFQERKDIKDYKKLIFKEYEEPMVSIIIPVYNQFEYTYNCLCSILNNTGDVSYEIIVADDHSTDLTIEMEKVIHGITVIHNAENLLFIRNCNNAARVSKGKYILFLNNDTQVQLNWLYPLVSLMEKNKDVGLVGSKLVFPNGKLQEAGGIIWNDASGWNYGREKNPAAPEYNYVRETDYISGASIMIDKELWLEIGGFDERFVPAYCEDSDLAFEVRKRGKKVLYQPESMVVHFEGVSNGKNIETGVKKYQVDNKEKFYNKWKNVLLQEHYPIGQNVLSACERKGKRKTVLIVSEGVPTYDKDAGSRTLDFYLKEFIDRGYIVKYIPDSFVAEEPYTQRLQQMGVEVFSGEHYKKNIFLWIQTYASEIDFAFLNYPNASLKYIDILKDLNIPVRYYGMDLHYLRNKREYELFGDAYKLKLSEEFYEKEKYLIQNSDVVYYPSMVEVDIVKREFQRPDAKQLLSNIFDVQTIINNYEPEKREGLMFIGGYRHTPNVDAVLWFANHIFPRVNNQMEITFYIAGADMPTEIKNIEIPRVVKLGVLTEQELEDMYNKVKMIVVPLRYGAGIKGKVIEALYHGVPMITTSIGMEGIPNESAAARVCDDENSFISAIEELYEDNEELSRMSIAGQEIIKKYYSREAAWNSIADDFI